ncbi:hypothetical protein, partial [uncultured Sutterella sp.]|uniref:hypothetical protein n=1 Tax=uncultured Sutterella sp. TaxID=286133 RepID=UPI00280A6D01
RYSLPNARSESSRRRVLAVGKPCLSLFGEKSSPKRHPSSAFPPTSRIDESSIDRQAPRSRIEAPVDEASFSPTCLWQIT